MNAHLFKYSYSAFKNGDDSKQEKTKKNELAYEQFQMKNEMSEMRKTNEKMVNKHDLEGFKRKSQKTDSDLNMELKNRKKQNQKTDANVNKDIKGVKKDVKDLKQEIAGLRKEQNKEKSFGFSF